MHRQSGPPSPWPTWCVAHARCHLWAQGSHHAGKVASPRHAPHHAAGGAVHGAAARRRRRATAQAARVPARPARAVSKNACACSVVLLLPLLHRPAAAHDTTGRAWSAASTPAWAAQPGQATDPAQPSLFMLPCCQRAQAADPCLPAPQLGATARRPPPPGPAPQTPTAPPPA